jgi:hypothetical protein
MIWWKIKIHTDGQKMTYNINFHALCNFIIRSKTCKVVKIYLEVNPYLYRFYGWRKFLSRCRFRVLHHSFANFTVNINLNKAILSIYYYAITFFLIQSLWDHGGSSRLFVVTNYNHVLKSKTSMILTVSYLLKYVGGGIPI